MIYFLLNECDGYSNELQNYLRENENMNPIDDMVKKDEIKE